ncbi:FHA domain-containing protein [Ditylenchus destructor]|uniref:FHA domain-containing protein n=1 Tax=Ditylenchus destructor TaxID=166010 RepID=A0AAD4ND01_9BILA|nr:FHA domain-containing protein [Ditylenchus destructor]
MDTPEAPSEKDRYKLPNWTGRPPHGSHLDVIKGKQLLQKLLVDEKGVYYFGRNPTLCDFVVEHASCSRVHAVLLYHKSLKKFAIVDLDSSHGTFVEKNRIDALTPVFLEYDSMFFFGASTRRYILRTSLDVRDSRNSEGGDSEGITFPEELELDNVTEYNTAQNRRIPQIPISAEECRRKNRPRPKLKISEDEDIINPEDVDPTVGRFRNMVRTAVIPTSGNNKIHVPGEEDDSDVNKPVYGPFMSTSVSTLGGISLNAAPDLEMYSIQKPLTSFGPGAAIRPNAPQRISEADASAISGEHHRKKYAKEAWPGRKPNVI